MSDPAEVKAILEDTLENPYWAGYYNEAPSEKCKEYISLQFYYSEYEDDETAEEMDSLEAEMTPEDLKHLLKYAGNTPEREKILKRLETLEK